MVRDAVRVGVLLALAGAMGCGEALGETMAPAPSTDGGLAADAPLAPHGGDGGEPRRGDVGPSEVGGGCRDDRACPAGLCVAGACVVCPAGPDCDADGVPDACALAYGRVRDCDDNGRPDVCDVRAGALDCDESGVPDVCEALAPRCVASDDPGHVRYLSGQLPVIVTAVHGGLLEPPELADREDPGPHDALTQELAEAIDEALHARTGLHPHRVVVDLHRDKLDANRGLLDGAQGDPGAEAAWRSFHGFVETARRAIELRHGAGLLLDVHGLSSTRPLNELGVLLSGAQLELPDERLDHPGFALESSLRRVGAQRLADLLRGPESFGDRLTRAGFPSVPSPDHPDPGRDGSGQLRPFYSGGYITWRHGSRAGGAIDAIQLETLPSIRNSGDARADFADTIAEALDALFPSLYAQPLEARTRVELEPPRALAWAGEAVTLSLVRTPPLDAPLTVELRALGATREARFAAGAARTEARLDLSAARPGPHPVGLAATPTVALGPPLSLDVLDPDRPGAVLEVVSPSGGPLLFGAPAIARLSRPRPGRALPPRPLLAEGARVRPRVELGLAEGATVAEATVTVDPAAPGGRTLRFERGASTDEARFEDTTLDPSLVLWLDGRRPLEDAARSAHPVLELPSPLERAGAGPAPPGLVFDGFDDRVWAEGVEYGGGRGFSVAFWFRADADRPEDGFRYIFSHGKISQSSSLNVYLTGSGQLRTALRGAADAYAPSTLDATGADLRDGRWHHYALVVTPEPVALVYLDGTSRSAAPRGYPIEAPRTGLHLGGRYDLSVTRELDGAIDEVMIWRRPLSADEVSALAAP